MTALEALQKTNDAGYEYIMSCIRDRCAYGFDYVSIHSDIIERFKARLLSDGYTITMSNTKISWANPTARLTPFNQ